MKVIKFILTWLILSVILILLTDFSHEVRASMYGGEYTTFWKSLSRTLCVFISMFYAKIFN